MKRVMIVSCACALYLAATMMSVAQSNITQPVTLGDTLIKFLQVAKPGWLYEPVDAITGSENVLLQNWSSETQRVRIAIVPHNSVDDATKAIRDIARHGQTKEILPGIGDEGLSWGRGTVSFRTRNLTINVSAVIATPVFDVKTAKANLVAEQNLSKEFARLVADAIKDKL